MSTETKKPAKPKTKAQRPSKDGGIITVVYLPQAEAMLTRRQIARLLSISLRALTSMISRGEYPKADANMGPQQPRWRAATHDAWVRKRCGLDD